MMGLPLRCRYWSVLQVVAIIICCRGKVSSEIAQGCVGSQLSLLCPEMTIIEVIDVVLGNSDCYFKPCCIKYNDCTYKASEKHRTDVHRGCDNKQNCAVKVLKKRIPCWYRNWRSYNDFERIIYNCRYDPRNATMNSTDVESTEDDHDPEPEDQDYSYNLMVQRCVGSRLSLSCPEMKVINIAAVVLGDSYGNGTVCLITDSNCSRNANETHTQDVRRRCDGQSSCTVDVHQEKIDCGNGNSSSNNDFERIIYNCTDDPQNYLTSTDGTLGNQYSNKEAYDQSGPGPTTDEPNSQALTVIAVIICFIILLAIVVLAIVMYQRKKRSQVKLFDPVAMTQIDNHQNESDITANGTQRTSLHIYSMPLSPADEADFPQAEYRVVYSEVELRQTVWTKGQSDRVTTDKTKAAIEAHNTGPDGAKGLVQNGDCFQDHIYSLALNDVADIYDNETAVESPTRLLPEVVSITPLPEDDEGLTVIENDLYSH